MNKRSLLYLYILLLLIWVLPANGQIAGNWKLVGPVKFPINVSGQINGIGRTTQIKFHPSNASKMYAATASGGLFISNDGGTTWNVTPGTDKLPRTGLASVCIDYTNDQVIYIGTGDPNYYHSDLGVYKSTNGGNSWSPANSGMGTRMAVDLLMSPNDHNVLIAATNDGIWKTTNGGASWSVKKSGGDFTQMIFNPGNANIIYAATHTQFFRSTDMGESWSLISLPGSGFVNGGRIAVSKSNQNIVYVTFVGDYNSKTCTPVLKSTDAGQSFTVVRAAQAQNLNGYDGGSNGQGNYNYAITADPNNANTVYIASHVVWKSTDGGANWSQLTQWWANIHTDMHQIILSPYNNSQVWDANDGGIWLSTDGGTNWTPKSDGLACSEIYRASQSPIRKDLIDIGTQDNGELHFVNNTWYTNGGGDYGGHTSFDYQDNQDVYHLNDNGDRKRLTGSGSRPSFTLPFSHGDGNGNDVEIDFNPLQTNTAFISYTDVWRTTNLSSAPPTWTKISSFNTQVKSLVSSPADMNILYAVTNNGRVYRSDNALSGSPTFTNLAAPGGTGTRASIAPIKSNSNVVYISCGARVYRSADKGASWTDISAGLPNVNIIKILHDKYSTDESVYVGMATGVYYKNNTMSSWINFSNGLPTVANINELMLFNDGTANSEIRVGYYGRGVWGSTLYNNANSYVTITNPSNGAIVTPGSNITLTASVTAGTGKSISKVEFYNGSSLIGTATSSPYTITWSSVPAGKYTLTAKAYETTGTVVTSSGISINVSPVGATVYQDCNYGGYSVTLVEGSYTLSQLQALGVNNDDISSLKVQSGYQIILYADDNFTGTTLTLSSDNSCLVNNSFNDNASSIKLIRTVVNGTGDGLTANYFNGMNFETPKFSRKDAMINFDWGTGTPDPSVNVDQFSARWTGQIQPRYSETYTFYLNTDNGRRLWINNQLIVDKWVDDWGIEYTGTITLTANQKYDIRLEYFENNGGAAAKLEWSSPSQAREVVPTSQLYSNALPTVSITSPANNATVSATSSVTITTNVADSDGSIASVKFYNGTTLFGTVTASPFNYTINNIAAGSYQLTAVATDNRGGVTVSSVINVTASPLRTPENPANTLAGVDYNYYEGNWNAIPNFSSLSPVKSGSSTTGFDLALRNRDDQFAFSFTGFINVPTDGIYTFYTSSDDGSNLLIGNTVVVNNDGLHGTVEQSGTIGLKAGKHAITVNFFEQGGGQVLTVSYAGPGINKQVVPTSSLFRNAPVNNAPTISITAPANNATFAAPASINLTVNAQDSDGNVTKVEYYKGATIIATSTTSPFSYNWTNVAVGTYTLTAKAYDNGGASATSTAITVTVTNQAPSIAITAPANNATYTAPAAVNFTVNASDADGTVSKVEYYSGSSTTPFATVTASPFSYSWTNVAAGTYSITAKAYDNVGASTTSAAVSISVTTPSGVATVYQDCNYATTGYAVNLQAGNYTTAQLVAAGIRDNDISSIKVAAGYQVILFANDNFQGTPLVISADNSCLVNNSYNDVASSIKISLISANTPATVNVTSPTNNASFTAPASIAITATASDVEGYVSKVELYNGANLLTTLSASPYSYTWSGVAVGNYSITAKAYDNNGAVSTSSAVAVTVKAANQAPTVSITSPANNASFNAPATIAITATASDADGSVAKVELYNGSNLLATLTASPYNYSWTGVAVGTYSISAKAYDNTGATSTSSVSVTVKAPNQAPTVSITSPGNNASFTAPASISISVSASDADGSVSKVELYNGTSLLTTLTASPYTYTWSGVAGGNYTINAKAYDNLGTTASASVNVSVTAASACSGVSQYVENNGYVAGSVVQNSGSKYQCKPWPNSGWCNGASWAYAPGTGAYWTDAWDLVGSCNSPSVPSMTISTLTNSPNPFDAGTTISFSLEQEGNVTLELYNSQGMKVSEIFNGILTAGSHSFELGDKLSEGTYVCRLQTANKSETINLVKVARPKAMK